METTDDTSAISTASMEHAILEHIKQAMRVTLNWQAPEVSLPRKVNSLQFTFKSLQRHLERVMSLEEEGGYMSIVRDCKPHLERRIQALSGDHTKFRGKFARLQPELDALAEWEVERFRQVCDNIRNLLDEIDRHDQAEVELLQESLWDEEGGQG